MRKIIGTSHISKDSVVAIRKEFESFDPDVVAVELDKDRLRSLKAYESGVTVRNPFALLISFLQNYLSKKTGISPGTEMLTAVELAEEKGVDVALIDQHITKTLESIKKVSKVEKFKVLAHSLMGVFGINSVDFDVTKVPGEEFIKKILFRFKIIFPGIYKALIDDRNYEMAHKIVELEQRYEKVLVVVGAGHKPGIEEILE